MPFTRASVLRVQPERLTVSVVSDACWGRFCTEHAPAPPGVTTTDWPESVDSEWVIVSETLLIVDPAGICGVRLPVVSVR